ncbi:putative oxidoreductase protein [Rhizobium etli CFN 42]|uniref:Oxidoreductase protein n=1 Tax=Rhizobium etli (strain ATCC 51251 / DSM 11541 / JCM 21823 / NBRC 15573 / CFN 42) TaxID=347834 RepID=Q2KBR0_RHIEC|nr:putative oxidoreductase protein [Rhizobium etli CFN 42]
MEHTCSDGGEAVIDEEVSAVDEARFVAGEIKGGARHILRLADPALLGGDGGIRNVDAERLQVGHLAQPVRCADEAGADGIAADVAVAELHRDGAGKHVHGALGRVVKHFHRRGGDRRDRRGADDRAAAGGDHLRQHRLGHQEHRAHIDCVQPVPFLERRFQKGFDDDRAGMVEQHSDGAVAFLDAGDRGIDGSFIGDIGGPVVGFATGITDRFHGFGRRLAIAVDDRDTRAFRRKQL